MGAGEGGKGGELVGVGLIVDAKHRRQGAHGKEARHRFVGGEHELLDQAVGVVARAASDLGHPSALVEDDLRLGQVEVDGSAQAALPGELLRQLAGDEQVRHQRGRVGVRRAAQRRSDLGVGEPRVAAHHRVVEIGLQRPAFGVERQIADHAEAVDVGVERADAVRQALGEHRQHGAGKVDAGAAAQAFAIERTARPHVVGHVGDGDHQAVAGAHARDVDGVVEVARVLAVDGDERQRAQIAAADDVLGAHVRGHVLRCEQGRRIELVGEAGSVRRGEDLEAWIAARAEHLHDVALQLTARAAAVALQPHLDHVVLIGAVVARHDDVLGETAVVGNDPGRLALRLVGAERELPAALDHLDHLARGAPVAALGAAHADHVAVERALRLAGRNEDVVLPAAAAEERVDEAVAFGLEVQHADHFAGARVGLRGALFGAALARPFGHGRRQTGGCGCGAVDAAARALFGTGRFRRVLLFGGCAVELAVEEGAPFGDQLREGFAEELLLVSAEPKLLGELLEGGAAPAGALQHASEIIDRDVHGWFISGRARNGKCRLAHAAAEAAGQRWWGS